MNEHFKKKLQSYIDGEIDNIYDDDNVETLQDMFASNSIKSNDYEQQQRLQQHLQQSEQALAQAQQSRQVQQQMQQKLQQQSQQLQQHLQQQQQQLQQQTYNDVKSHKYKKHHHQKRNNYQKPEKEPYNNHYQRSNMNIPSGIISDDDDDEYTHKIMQKPEQVFSQEYASRNYENKTLRFNDKYGLDYLDKTKTEKIKFEAEKMAEKILKVQNKIEYYKAIKKKTSIKLEEYTKRKDVECEPLVNILYDNRMDSIIHDNCKFTVVNGKNKKYIKITRLK